MVCISRILGAGGTEVGLLVADALGFRHVDEEIVQQAAAAEGLSTEALDEVERRKTFIDKVLQNLALAGGVEGYMVGVSGLTPPGPSSDPTLLRALIRKSIEETADRGDVVIVSHAASYALTNRIDVLRVLVTASPTTRAARVAIDGSHDEKRAAKIIAEDDAGRAAYLKKFYGVERESPTHYDLALNSDSMPTEVIADLVVRAALAD